MSRIELENLRRIMEDANQMIEAIYSGSEEAAYRAAFIRGAMAALQGLSDFMSIPLPDVDLEHMPAPRIKTPRGTFTLLEMTQEEAHTAGYGLHFTHDECAIMSRNNTAIAVHA